MAENYNYANAGLHFRHPQLALSCSTPGRMWLVSICAFLAVLQSGFTDSFKSLVLALAAVLAALFTEFLFLKKSGKTASLKDGSAVASALILTLLLPNQISPVYAVFGAVFAIAVVKHCFGGLGSNWLNPAAGGWLFIRLAWPRAFSEALDGSPLSLLADAVSTGGESGPFSLLKTQYADVISQGGFAETYIRPALNNTVFSFLGTELPSAYMDLFTTTQPGIIADRGIPALLLGTILIIAFRAGRSWIPAAWIAVFSFLTWLTGAIPYGGGLWKGDVLFALCSGGTLVSAFLLASDPASFAKSRWCTIAAAILGGFFAWLFRFSGGEPYGAIVAVLVVNALLPVIRNIEYYRLYEKGRKP